MRWGWWASRFELPSISCRSALSTPFDCEDACSSPTCGGHAVGSLLRGPGREMVADSLHTDEVGAVDFNGNDQFCSGGTRAPTDVLRAVIKATSPGERCATHGGLLGGPEGPRLGLSIEDQTDPKTPWVIRVMHERCCTWSSWWACNRSNPWYDLSASIRR